MSAGKDGVQTHIAVHRKPKFLIVDMIKKLFAMAAALFVTATANAQFEQGKLYLNGSLTGLNLSYNGTSKFNAGASGQMGYMVADDWLLYGMVGYNHYGAKGVSDNYYLGAGGRYYIEQNGIYLGMNCKLMHTKGYTDVMPGFEIGYAYFLSRTVTLEPAIYYDQSFKKHSDYSTIGLKIGLGIYLFND